MYVGMSLEPKRDAHTYIITFISKPKVTSKTA